MKQDTYDSRKLYDFFIDYISKGQIEFEGEARAIAERCGFPTSDLEKALESGNANPHNQYSSYSLLLLHIGQGFLELEGAARRLADKYGMYTTDINLAKSVGSRLKDGEEK